MQNQNSLSSHPKRKNPPPQQKKRSLTPTVAVKLAATSLLNDIPKNCSLAGSDLPSEEELLNPTECDLWSSSFGAKYAVGLHMPICRQLGVIERTLKAKKGFALSKLQENPKKKKRKVGTKTPMMMTNEVKVKTMAIPTINQAKKHIMQVSSEDVNEKVIEKRAQEWQKQWRAVREKGRFVPGFDSTSGEFLDRHLHDDGAITCGEVLACMKRRKPQLEDISATPSLYSPYPTTEENKNESMIKFDTPSVLEALVDLMRPHSKLYNQPLVVAHARLLPENRKNGKDHLYRLHIAVYANRLLFEVMTQELQVIMAALDQSSYKIDQPLKVPPSITLATQDFASAAHPKVRFDGYDSSSSSDNEDDATMDSNGAEQQEEGATRGNTKTVDAFSIPGLLKLIENTGTFDETLWDETLQPKLVKRDNKSGLNLDLLDHQKHGLCWCYQMERLGNLNRLVWERRQFAEGDSYYYSPALGQVRLKLSEEGGSGGVLCDEMGLGKTIQILALIVATLDDVKAETQRLKDECDDVEDNDYYHHTTLIIVPPALLSQWISEIQKVAPWLVVDALVCGRGFTERVQEPQGSRDQVDADIIVTTYHAVEDNYKNAGRKSQQIPCLADFHFSRIVLDEMQEIRSFTNRISKVVNALESDRRWMLSGTPLLEGVSDLRGELCFLGLEPFAAANDDGFFDFAIESHWENKSRYGLSVLRMMAGLIMLRRSKSMVIRQTGQPLLGLKPFTLTYEPVPQEESERALYCFLEYLMHTSFPENATVTNNDETGSNRNRLQNRQLQRNKFSFLRMLRELCVSPTLLNGGLGSASQLDTLNRWMKGYNRRHHQARQSGSMEVGNPRQASQNPRRVSQTTMSCDEAVVYLSQVEDVARTDGDFVTDARFGGGGGITNRNRASDFEKRFKEKTDELERTKKLCKTASHKWAKAHWHKALELVTTGRLFAIKNGDFYQKVNPEIRRLWLLRRCAISNSSPRNKSVALFRGWRSSENLLNGSSGRKFLFANPFAFILSDIPSLVSKSDVSSAILECIRENESYDPEIEVVPLRHEEGSKMWKAALHLQNKADFEYVLNKIKSLTGIQIQCSQNIPFVDEEIADKNIKMDEAIAANRVHPNLTNAQTEARAKKEYSRAQLGLRIICSSKKCSAMHVGCEKGLAKVRDGKADSSKKLLTNTAKQIDDATSVFAKECNTTITKQHDMIKEKEEELQRMDTKIKNYNTRQVSDLTTVGVLQALKEGGQEVDCDICLDRLGFGYDAQDGIVALTKCGHLSCRRCMLTSIQQNQKCFQCRKPVTPAQLVFVDPKKKDDQVRFEKKQAEAKSLVQQAAEMLDNNHGMLEPHLWEALYLSMPLPTNVSRNAHHTFTAIPPHVLAHLRNATNMPVHCTRKQPSDGMGFKLSNKIRALLSDLPKDELSVVFASSKATIQHLLVVFEKMKIGCRALFTGQSEKDSELAVAEWQSDDNVNVLVVQAGAAACGLTLTAASKMFLLDPFLKHEEEKQAYARLHRYGQTKEVFCKVYYTPVSVESRLLEWRHRHEKETPAAAALDDEERMIFAPLRNVVPDVDEEDDVSSSSSDDDDEDEDEDDDESPDDIRQTQFLLGLT